MRHTGRVVGKPAAAPNEESYWHWTYKGILRRSPQKKQKSSHFAANGSRPVGVPPPACGCCTQCLPSSATPLRANVWCCGVRASRPKYKGQRCWGDNPLRALFV